jgi:hypothetical protein
MGATQTPENHRAFFSFEEWLDETPQLIARVCWMSLNGMTTLRHRTNLWPFVIWSR